MGMNILLTTALPALNQPFQSHITNSGQTLYSATLWNTVGHVVYGHEVHEYPIQETIYVSNGISGMCAGDNRHHFNDNLKAAEALVKGYINYVENKKEHWAVELTSYSCLLFDFEINTLWLVGDRVGSVPLWYSISSTDQTFMITSDLIAAQRIGYNHPLTPLGPGQVIALDIATSELKHFSQWQSKFKKKFVNLKEDDVLNRYTDNLFDAANKAVLISMDRINDRDLQLCLGNNGLDSSISSSTEGVAPRGRSRSEDCSNRNTSLLMELDVMDSSSLLLDLLLTNMDIPRATRTSRPLVSDGRDALGDAYHLLLGDICIYY